MQKPWARSGESLTRARNREGERRPKTNFDGKGADIRDKIWMRRGKSDIHESNHHLLLTLHKETEKNEEEDTSLPEKKGGWVYKTS